MPAELFQYKVPSKRWGQREGLILHWNDGWGEIAPLPGFSQESLAQAREEILFCMTHIKQAKPQLPSVRFGLLCASQPFEKTPFSTPLAALERPRDGFTTLKIKVGSLSVEDAIRAVAPHIGRYQLRIDCNRKWNLEQALCFAAAFKSNDFEYLEEPLATFEELIRFSEMTHFPIAVDESIRDCPVFRIPSLKALVAKPTILGFIPTPPPGIDLILSSSYESSVGLIHLARNAPANGRAHGLDTVQADFLDPPLYAEEGFISWKPIKGALIQKEKLCLIATVP